MPNKASHSSRRQLREPERKRRQAQREEGEKRAGRRKFLRRAALWAGALLGLGAIVLGLIIITDPDLSGVSRLSNREPPDERARGNPSAPISLVEYSDFQCPACARYHELAERLVREEGEKFRYTFRHYPLKRHRNAELAAVAAEAAGRQGKFWEMHDRLFKRQKEWDQLQPQTAEVLFADYAVRLGLDREAFERDLGSQVILDKVRDDYRSGMQSGVKSTPTFFLNGKRVAKLPRSYRDFRSRILKHETPSP